MLKCAKFACNEISNLYALDISVHNKGTTMQDYYAWTLKTHNCNSCQPFDSVKRNNWVAEDDHSEHCEIKRWARKGKSFSPLVCLWPKLLLHGHESSFSWKFLTKIIKVHPVWIPISREEECGTNKLWLIN